eukprot:Seg50.1 transcript_id=Seg50.1/GoldUCD/mRNA.D3Y31 product="hypothetical protein" protein_id=Seg50.1/GoldUCD/D3Y31
MEQQPITMEDCEQEKVRETAGKTRKRTQFRIPTPDSESEPIEEKREKSDLFEFCGEEDDRIKEDTTISPLQSDDSNGANETASYEATATASLSKDQSEKPYETIEIHDERESSSENHSFSVSSSTANLVREEQPSTSTPKAKDKDDMQPKYKSGMLQTYFGSKSARGDKYPHARSKNIKLLAMVTSRVTFRKQKASMCIVFVSGMKTLKSYADWTLKKTRIMKQEVSALENKVTHLKDIYAEMDENILAKTNVAKNDDRVGVAAKVVDDCNEALIDIKDKMNQCFNTSERQNIKKEKIRLETVQNRIG